ncbi:MAG: DUF3365 domain-containing protein, partial [Cyanobacteria bacterium J06642_11]
VYKEATINPTNPEDQADDFEQNLVDRFRTGTFTAASAPELHGYRTIADSRFFFTARPLTVNKPSCLECHGPVSRAPKSMVQLFGDQHDYNWKLGEIVAAQTIYVPADSVFRQGHQYLKLLIAWLVGVLTIALLLLNRLLKHKVVHPLRQLTQLTQGLSQQQLANNQINQVVQGLDPLTSEQNETGQLARTFQTMVSEMGQREQYLRSEIVQRQCAEQSLQTTMEKLHQTQVTLVQQEKLSTLGEMMAGIAHEINNPLGCLAGNVGFIRDYSVALLAHLRLYQDNGNGGRAAAITDHAEEIDLDFVVEDTPQVITAMETSCDRISNISRALRTFARYDQRCKVSFNLHEGLEGTLLLLKHRLKPQAHRAAIDVQRDYGTLNDLECFPGQINQVFMNLLANAVDAFDEHPAQTPRILVRTEMVEVSLSSGIQSHAQLTITDNAGGMPETVRRQIFERDFTTKAAGKGTGLGLSIARQIVMEAHGGQLFCTSEAGQGSVFTLQLPYPPHHPTTAVS